MKLSAKISSWPTHSMWIFAVLLIGLFGWGTPRAIHPDAKLVRPKIISVNCSETSPCVLDCSPDCGPGYVLNPVDRNKTDFMYTSNTDHVKYPVYWVTNDGTSRDLELNFTTGDIFTWTGNASLQINVSRVTPTDFAQSSSVYSCLLRQPSGLPDMIIAEYSVTFFYPAELISASDIRNIHIKPTFRLLDKVSCDYKGYPPPRLQWIKFDTYGNKSVVAADRMGTPDIVSDKYRITINTIINADLRRYQSFLKIIEGEQEDSGIYRCEVLPNGLNSNRTGSLFGPEVNISVSATARAPSAPYNVEFEIEGPDQVMARWESNCPPNSSDCSSSYYVFVRPLIPFYGDRMLSDHIFIRKKKRIPGLMHNTTYIGYIIGNNWDIPSERSELVYFRTPSEKDFHSGRYQKIFRQKSRKHVTEPLIEKERELTSLVKDLTTEQWLENKLVTNSYVEDKFLTTETPENDTMTPILSVEDTSASKQTSPSASFSIPSPPFHHFYSHHFHSHPSSLSLQASICSKLVSVSSDEGGLFRDTSVTALIIACVLGGMILIAPIIGVIIFHRKVQGSSPAATCIQLIQQPNKVPIGNAVELDALNANVGTGNVKCSNGSALPLLAQIPKKDNTV